VKVKPAAVALFVLALAAPARAQSGPPPHAGPPAHAAPGAKRAQAQQKLRQVRARLLRERVGLDVKTALAVEKILDKFQSERQRLHQAMREEKKKLRALLDLDSNDQAAYTRSQRSLLDVQQKLAMLKQQEFEELAKVLTPKQQAKLGREVDETMKRLRKGMRRQRGKDDD
jgi:Spy/CpxP family protein refolding chaperone